MIHQLRLAWFAAKERMFFRRYEDRAGRFGAIYAKRMWKNPESASGFGSTLAATRQTRAALEELVRTREIETILDAPCGDFNWMSHLRFAGSYTGLDIVPELIEQNNRQYGNERRRFDVADIVTDRLPKADLVMCRECLNHLPLGDGRQALSNLVRAARKLLVVTHYPEVGSNPDQPASFRYRWLNLTLAPFGLRQPDQLIDESSYQPGKVLAVWDMSRGSPFAG